MVVLLLGLTACGTTEESPKHTLEFIEGRTVVMNETEYVAVFCNYTKKLFSGDSLQAERKGETPFTLTPYATMIFSCNELPKSRDKSDGLYRRWIFIPFNAKISPQDEDYDPRIKEKILTEESMSHLLNLAIRGARRLINNGRFTEPECVVKMLERYKTDNSSILSWIEDKEISTAYMVETPCDYIYEDYREWCIQSGVRHITGKNTFFKEVIQEFKLSEKRMQHKVNDVRKWYFKSLEPEKNCA